MQRSEAEKWELPLTAKSQHRWQSLLSLVMLLNKTFYLLKSNSIRLKSQRQSLKGSKAKLATSTEIFLFKSHFFVTLVRETCLSQHLTTAFQKKSNPSSKG
jgi:hypothetical protein